MAGTVDNLNIKIDASARGANQQLDKLVQKMIQLRSTVNGINVGNLNNLSISIRNFSRAASGLSQVKTTDFSRMAKGIEKLSNIREGELNKAAGAITNISKAVSNIGNVSDGADKIAQLAQGISRLGYKSTTQAIQNIPLLTKELKNMMTELSKAPTVSDNLIAMTNAMANLGAQASGIRSVGSTMNNAGRSGNSFFGIMKRGISNVWKFASSVRSATSHNRSFASTIGLLYARFWMLKRTIGAVGSAVKSSMDYIEEYNYFNTTMEKIASEWKKDFSKYGYKNADAYGKSFEDRVTKMMNKMTGFQMNRNGKLTDSGVKNLGLDVTQMTNYAAGVAQVTNSVGMTGEASAAASKALSMLAGDMSSFRNLDMETVMNNFSSGLIGQSRALYKYGIDITNATLTTYAHELGIKKDISTMTQNEKMQLRMIAILDQSKVAWGDLAKTINSPSNQLRLLQNNFKSLSRTIGDMFLPVVSKVLPYVNGLVIAICRLFEWTASMLGIDLKDVIGNSGGGYSDIFDSLGDDADDVSNGMDGLTDSTNNAAEAQKKLNKQVQRFDNLNNMTTSTNKGSSSDKNNNNGSPIDLTDQLNSALADYEKVWNDAYDSMTNDAEKFADKLTKLFKSAWTSGDGSDIGSAVAGWLNKGIDWVNNHTDKWSKGLKKITTIMGTSLNGFVENFKWAGLGKAVGNSIKGVLEAETNFFSTVNWVNLGKGLSKTLNAAIKTGVLQSYFKAMASKLRAAIEIAFGAITTFDFKGLGNALGQGINDFFKTMNKKNKQTGLNGWQELGKGLSDGIGGIADTITTVLKKVKWVKVGQAIGDFIAAIDFGKVAWNFAKLVSALVGAIAGALKGSFSKAPIETAFLVMFAGLKYTGIGKFIAGEISKKMAASLAEKMGFEISKDAGISTAIKTALKQLITKAGLTSLTVSVGVIGIAAATVGLVAFYNYVEEKANEKIQLDMSEANKELGDLNSSAKKCKKSVDETKDALKKIEKRDKNAEKKGEEIDSLATAYYKLSKKVNKTKAEKAILKKMSKELSKEMPGLKKNINKETGSYTGNWKELKKLVKQTKEYYKAKAAQKDLADIGNKLYENEKNIAEAEKDAKKASAKLKNERIDLKNETKRLNELEAKNIKYKSGSANMTKKEYEEMEKLRGTLPKLALKIQDQEKIYDNHKKKLGELKDTQKELNDKYNTASDYIDKYTTKINKNTESVGKQKDAIKGVGEETDKLSGKNATVSINSKGVEKTKKDIDGIQTKKVKVTANAKKGKDFDKTKKDYDHFKSKNADVKLKIKGADKLKEVAKNPLLTDIGKKNTIKRSVEITFKMKNGLSDSVSKLLGGLGTTKKKAQGGVFSGGSWHNITKYANGGLPNMGQMFVAREAGPELVGTIGGHTAVMNNNQIVASVSDGVFNALNPVLTYLCNSINAMSAKMDNMGSGGVSVEKYTEGDLLKVVRKEDSNYRKRTGKSAFAL
jgi:methyl-accepting chemotaxis protein|nr:MAG TPA: minor tail protein [Caudoviricetes sp.]